MHWIPAPCRGKKCKIAGGLAARLTPIAPLIVNAPPSPSSLPPRPTTAADQLRDFLAEVEGLAATFVGDPCSQDCDDPELAPFLGDALHNVGAPFGESINRENTFAFEREVVAFFQKHLRAYPGNTWGYLTASGTEGQSLRALSRANSSPTAASIAPRARMTAA